jgi:regulator of protease activity HflC (stomatin/prohibitin superfamily)
MFRHKWEGQKMDVNAMNERVTGVLRSRKLKIIVGGIVLLLILLVANPFLTIPAGHRGVVLNWGAVQKEVLPEGLAFRWPIYQQVVKADVRILVTQPDCDAVTKDQQVNHTKVAVNYHVIPSEASWVHQNVGSDYKEKLVFPKIQEIVKAITARYTALELISKREQIRNEMKDHLKEALHPYKIIVDDFSVVNFKWDIEFQKAIEAKQVAEQLAMKAQRDLERIKIEAEQKITQAKAEAESLRLQKENVTPHLIKLRQIEASIKAIEKWNGQLPRFSGGGAIPFIDVKSLEEK